MASGRPSSRTQNSASADACSEVSANAGHRPRAIDEQRHGRRSWRARRARPAPWIGERQGGTGNMCSQRNRRAARLVATIFTADRRPAFRPRGGRPRGRARNCRAPATPCLAPGSPGARERPAARPMAGRRAARAIVGYHLARVTSGARSTKPTPSGKWRPPARPARRPGLVLPTPACPSGEQADVVSAGGKARGRPKARRPARSAGTAGAGSAQAAWVGAVVRTDPGQPPARTISVWRLGAADGACRSVRGFPGGFAERFVPP